MNEQLRKRIKSKAKRGVPLHLIAVDIASITGQRMVVEEISRILEEPEETPAPLSPSEIRSQEREQLRKRCLHLVGRGYRKTEIATLLGISRHRVSRLTNA